MKTKLIIHNEQTEFEKIINNFLNNEVEKLISIQYSPFKAKNEFLNTIIYFSALITYEEKKK